jgi:hypothetical protein
MSRYTWAVQAPLDGWLPYLAAGWRLPEVVAPMGGNHGRYAILLTRDDDPNTGRAIRPVSPGAERRAFLSYPPDGDSAGREPAPCAEPLGKTVKRPAALSGEAP